MKLTSYYTKSLSDLVSPVGVYLRIRDLYPHSFLLEGSDYRGVENSCSFIGLDPIFEVEVDDSQITKKLFGKVIDRLTISDRKEVVAVLDTALKDFNVSAKSLTQDVSIEEKPLCGFFGYITFESIEYFEDISLTATVDLDRKIPRVKYILFRNVIQINHFKSELYIQHNVISSEEDVSEEVVRSQIERLENIITQTHINSHSFAIEGKEESNFTDDDYYAVVEKCKEHIKRGDVFQIVPSRRFSQGFSGDDFQVYRSLRAINPSPYLFYFDCGGYRLFGSSPEALIVLKSGVASSYPIAGTYFRKGTQSDDEVGAAQLLADEKENAEHVMLVDLARNDLSRLCSDVRVSKFKEVQFYSHVIHLVSRVDGNMDAKIPPFELLQATFPAGTLSGAPKYRAMQLIDSMEKGHRSHYAGAVGYVTFEGDVNHAIMIRSFLSKNNVLHYQAGGGVVADSVPSSEVQEVKNKLGALQKAIVKASESSAQRLRERS